MFKTGGGVLKKIVGALSEQMPAMPTIKKFLQNIEA